MKYTLLIIILFVANLIFAQSETTPVDLHRNTGPIRQYAGMFPSYISGSGDSPVTEACIGPEIYLAKNKNETRSFVIGSEVFLRIYNHYSVPVLPPSYMPYVSVFQFFGKENNWYVEFKAKHHSNGSDREFFLPDGSINIRYGSFATNFLKLSVGYLRPTTNEGEVHRFELSISRDVTIDNTVFEFDQILKNNYGRNRIWFDYVYLSPEFTSFTYQGKPTYWQLQFRLSQKYIVGNLSLYSNYNTPDLRYSIKTSILFNHTILGVFQPFMQWYYGRDYYNIRFVENLNSVMIGLNMNL